MVTALSVLKKGTGRGKAFSAATWIFSLSPADFCQVTPRHALGVQPLHSKTERKKEGGSRASGSKEGTAARTRVKGPARLKTRCWEPERGQCQDCLGLFPNGFETRDWELKKKKNKEERRLSTLGQCLPSAAAADAALRRSCAGWGVPLIPHQEKENLKKKKEK